MPIYRVPVRIDYRANGGPGYNVFHVRTVSSARDELLSALDAIEAMYNSMKGLYVDTTILTVGEGMIKDPLGAPEYVNDSPRTVLGSGGASTMPTLLAVCASWRTSSATRSGRGRTFFGPFNNNTQDGNDGTPGAVTITTVRDAALDLVQASQGLNDWGIGVLSLKTGILRDITGVTVQDRWSYLSSRRD